MEEIKPGIYLERKKGIIGTGSTAKETEYRNFWMTISQKEDVVQCLLLNNDFKLTTVKEEFTVDLFAPPRFVYIPQGDKRYQKLMDNLPGANKKKEGASGSDSPKPANWWEQPQKEIKKGDFFTRDESEKKPKPSRVQDAADIFGRPPLQAGQKIDAKKKGKKSEVILKKNWWSS